jgi:site-specific DNA-methyltransferase (adenine-specific)
MERLAHDLREVPLPDRDNTPEGLSALQSANRVFRETPWQKPFDLTKHVVRVGDARDLSSIEDESIHLVVTSPPYWTLKEYPRNTRQLGEIQDYSAFLDELDRVWRECARVLIPGGRICCVVGDVCVSRKRTGRHHVMPLHADIEVRARAMGLDCLTPIIWNKIANGALEAKGNGGGFYGKPYQPGAIVKNDIEYVLFLRKGGKYRSATPLQKALSMLSKEEMQAWWKPIWTDVKGAPVLKSGHPAPFPVEIAYRLIRMFSFAGDTVLDPFAGTGSTGVAAIAAGRNSISVEIEPPYVKIAYDRMTKASLEPRLWGPTRTLIEIAGAPPEVFASA